LPLGMTPFTWLRFIEPTSNDCDRGGSCFDASCFWRSDVNSDPPQCFINCDLLSSMGVNILDCLDAGRGFGCGRGGLLKCV
jgi:hypothetical protein